jgi:hypothetical protein
LSQFNLVLEPWLPAVIAGRTVEVSLFDALTSVT